MRMEIEIINGDGDGESKSIVLKDARRNKVQRSLGALRRKVHLRRGLL